MYLFSTTCGHYTLLYGKETLYDSSKRLLLYSTEKNNSIQHFEWPVPISAYLFNIYMFFIIIIINLFSHLADTFI